MTNLSLYLGEKKTNAVFSAEGGLYFFFFPPEKKVKQFCLKRKKGRKRNSDMMFTGNNSLFKKIPIHFKLVVERAETVC